MDENLKGVGDLVKEALAGNGDASIQEGVTTQSDLDAQNAQGNAEPQPQQPQPEPQKPDTVTSPDAPVQQTTTPVQPGDKVAGAEPTPEPTPQVDPFEAQWKEKFGDRSVEDVQKAINEATDVRKLYEDTQAKLDQKLNPFANEEIASLNSFIKETGINDSTLFNKLKGANLEEMEPQKILEINMKKENPNLTDAEIRGYIQRRYNITEKKFDHIIDDDERRAAEIAHKNTQEQSIVDMKIDANKAKATLAELQEKIRPVDLKAEMETRQAEYEQQMQAATEAWNPHIAKSIEELRQYPIELPGENGQNQQLSFEVSGDKLAVYQNQAMQFAISNGLDATTQEGQNQVNQFMANMILIDHKDQIIQKVANATRSSMELEVDKEISNPTGATLPPNPDQTPRVKETPKTVDELEEDVFNAALGQIESGDY